MRERLLRCDARIRTIGRFWRVPLGIAGLGSGAFLTIAIGIAVVVSTVNGWASFWVLAQAAANSAIGVVVAAAAWTILTGRTAYATRKAAAIMLEEHLCPACAADLTGQTPEQDNCTTCPECGAAWNLTGHEPPDRA